jgi:hypothetical protein
MSLTKFDGVHSSIGLVFDLQTAEPTDSSYALNVGSGLASAGLWMESDGIHWSYNGTEFSITASYSDRHLTETVAEANVIAASESGTVFFLNDATEFASTLPAPAAGLHFTFIVTGAPAGADYTITTNAGANIILGMVVASTGGDEDSETSGCDTISFVGGTSTVGDKVDVYCDGTNWFAYGICDAAGAITLTTAA